jgi:putative N6-adenine-specific DNA methylase
MCGSGTIPIEAALWARRVAPGLARDRFGFERWACHDEAAARRMRELRDQARAKIVDKCPPITGSDVDLEALAIARENAAAAGVSLSFKRASLRDLAPLVPPGIIVTNPPYGERIEAPDLVYEDLGRAIGTLKGHRFAILAGAPSIVRFVRRRPTKSLTVYNGDIECRLLTYDVPG